LRGRRVEDPLERAKASDRARVRPERIERVHARHRQEHRRRKTEERERRVEDPLDHLIQPALPERDRKVVLLALVVDDVRGPHEADAVAHAVKGVVREIDAENQHHPRGHGIERDRGQAEMVVDPRVPDDAQHAEEDAQQLLPDAAA
jgi:hypothetical protein